MAVFRKFKGINMKYSYRDPQKAHLTRNDVFWRILRKNQFKGVGCSLIEEPQKTKKKLVTPEARQNHVFGEQKPRTDRHKILHAGCHPGRNHTCQFLWRSVKGFWCGEGSNFGLFHWLNCFVAFKTWNLRLRNDLYCVGWGFKLYSLTHSLAFKTLFALPCECVMFRPRKCLLGVRVMKFEIWPPCPQKT